MHLHVWVTHSFLFEAPRIMRAWGGFQPESVMVSVKPSMGNGYSWRAAAGFLLQGVRGRLPFRDHSVINWLRDERGERSMKPEVLRGLMARVSPRPRLEMFERRPIDGWTVWGNQIEHGLFDTDILRLEGVES